MERQLNLLSVSNLNLGYILRKSENLLTKCNFTSDFKNFCQISLLINPPNLYIQIKFPTYFTQSHTRLVYYPSNPEFPIEKALNSNEILHNEDQDYEGNTIKFSEFPSNDNSVSFSYSPGIVTSLLISLLEGTYEEGLLNIVTNRRGNKEIVGILKIVKKHRIFKKMPKNLEFSEIIVENASSSLIYYKLPSTYRCDYKQICYNYLVKCKFDLSFFHSKGTRCYCISCFPGNYLNHQNIGGETYIIPRGWVRFGIKTSFLMARQNDIWDKWCNVFHGTSPTAAKNIIQHKTLLINSDIRSDGKRLGKKASKKEYFKYYVSPHICYASHPWYSNVLPFKQEDGTELFAQVVVACKIRSNTYGKQKETENGKKVIFDDYRVIPKNEIEWFSKRRGCIVPYGLLVRVFGAEVKKEVEKKANDY